MSDISVSIASRVSFKAFASLLEKINATHGKVDAKRQLLEKFIDLWRKEASEAKNTMENPNIKIDDSFFPVMRLLLPGDDRRIYGLKEKKLADCLINVLSIDKKSNDALKLLNYRAPQNVKTDGDFASVAYFVFKNRCKDNLTMTIQQINHHLNNISLNNAKGKDGIVEVNKSIRELIVNLSAIQLKWLLRIILKDLKIGMKETPIFEAFHSDACDLYNCTSSLEKVCELLGDPNKRLNEVTVCLFTPCRPMLSEKTEPNKIEAIMQGKSYYIETKYDGERFQLHKNDKNFMYFSRNGNDYSDTFGSDHLTGKLSQFIWNTFKPGVRKVILDGEMCVYNASDKILLSKGETFDVKSMSTASLANNLQICFCVFDILMLNDEILTNKVLEERVKYLEKCFEPVEGRLVVSQRQLATSNQQAVDALNNAIDSRLEGIVIKDPESVYAPNKRSAGWFKVKPDYMLGLNDDLDLIIIGGYYGSGRRKGLLSHFLLGVIDDERKCIDDDASIVCQSFCKIGSGYTLQELSDFNQKLTNKWLKFDKKNAPTCIQVTYERPDVWIEPKDSLVVQVKAVEIIESDKYKCGLSLRFPRLEKFRDDKSPSDAMKLSELKQLRDKNNGKLVSNHYNLEDNEPVVKKKRTQRIIKVTTVDKHFKGIDPSEIQQIGELFKDKEICIAYVSSKLLSITKQSLEKSIIEYGGSIVQNPTPQTFCILTSTDRIILKVKNYIDKKCYDIVKLDWLNRCLNDKIFHSWSPSDMIFSTQKAKEYFSQNFDKYGDSFTNEVDNVKLKEIFAGIDMNDLKENDSLIHDRIAFIENKYFPNDSFTNGLFRLCCIFVSDTIDHFDLINISLKWYGASCTNHVCLETTHCIVNENFTNEINRVKSLNRARQRKFHVINEKWINACIEKKRIVNELPYHL